MQGRQSYNEKICGKILRFSRIWYSHKGRFIDRYDPRLFLHCQRSGLFYLFLIRFKETCNRCLYQKRSCHSNYAISLKRRDRTKHRTSYIHCKHKARRHTSFRVARRSKTHLRRHNRIGRLSFFSKINCKPRAVAELSCLERYENKVPVAGSMCGASLLAAAEASGNRKCRKARISLQTETSNQASKFSHHSRGAA